MTDAHPERRGPVAGADDVARHRIRELRAVAYLVDRPHLDDSLRFTVLEDDVWVHPRRYRLTIEADAGVLDAVRARLRQRFDR